MATHTSAVEASRSDQGGAKTAITRLHVSGLNATLCTLDDVKARFSSFGLTVTDVHNWPPARTAVGELTNWCFVTVQGEEGKVRRAMGLLNGTMWKGSKLRIGNAKEAAWNRSDVVKSKARAQEEKVEEQEEGEGRKKSKKRRRGIDGEESADLNTPVSVESVERGTWGWKKTPAGYLVRPMHMRPDHPLPRPSAVKDDAVSASKAKRKSKPPAVKPLVRAKRITIDPSRYNAVHLSGLMLEDGNMKPVLGHEWQCQENEEGTSALWTLRDVGGNVVRQETFALRPIRQEGQAAIESDSSGAEDLADVFDEVDAAIDNASDDLSESYQEQDEHMESVEAATSEEHDDGTLPSPQYPHYDPEEEDAFSDGYQEMNSPEPVAATLDWAGEKSGQIDLLKRMFGAEELKEGRSNTHQAKPVDLEEEDCEVGDLEGQEESIPESHDPANDEDASTLEKVAGQPKQISSGVARRAALLKVLQPVQKGNQFQPIVRFDPAAEAGREDDSAGQASKTSDDAAVAPETEKQAADKAPSAAQARPADHIEMNTLTDMFRPKKDNAGFSLMADMDLDLDDELNFEPTLEDDEDETGSIWTRRPTEEGQAPTSAVMTSQSANATKPLIFPTFDAAGALRTDGKDVFAQLIREENEAKRKDPTSALATFFQADDEETLARKWEERKANLTQAYKRRHREALKKKKRKFTGSRAAGTALPGRRIV